MQKTCQRGALGATRPSGASYNSVFRMVCACQARRTRPSDAPDIFDGDAAFCQLRYVFSGYSYACRSWPSLSGERIVSYGYFALGIFDASDSHVVLDHICALDCISASPDRFVYRSDVKRRIPYCLPVPLLLERSPVLSDAQAWHVA